MSGIDVGRRPAVLIANWRDTGHPEGGGSELYVEELADGLAERGYLVTLVCASYPNAPSRERRASGVEVVRLGHRMSVYARTAAEYLRRRLGRPDVIIEVQNGMPFLARLWARKAKVVVLVHHVHREQWRVVMPAPLARLGWWIESRLAPRVNRHVQYVTVSNTTRRELASLGIAPEHIAVIHNGTPAPVATTAAKADRPTLLVVSRLVPHKRIEIAIETLSALVDDFPEISLTIAGRGWWEPELRRLAEESSVADRVLFAGYVSDEDKARLFREAWVSLVPSMKEGWGLVVTEAGVHETPSVGFADAAGVSESIIDGRTGLLAADTDEFVAKVRLLLDDHALREQLGAQAASHARSFTWEQTVADFDSLIGQIIDRPSQVEPSVGQREP